MGSSIFSKKTPFTSDINETVEVRDEQVKKLGKNAPPMHEELSVIRPKESKKDILGDLGRDIEANTILINGISVLELRKRDLTQKQREILNLSAEQINELHLDNIQSLMTRHLKEPFKSEEERKEIEARIESIIQCQSTERARIELKNYQTYLHNKIGFLVDNGHTLDEFKTFLKKHLLTPNERTNPDIDTLFSTCTSCMHQSGLGKAASAFFISKSYSDASKLREDESKKNTEVKDSPFFHMKDTQGDVRVNIGYKNGSIDLTEVTTFRGIQQTDGKVVEANKGDYLARVRIQFHIKAVESKNEEKKACKIECEPLIVDVKKQSDPKVAKFLGKVFDDTRSSFRKYIETLFDNIIEKITHRKQKLFEIKPEAPQEDVSSRTRMRR